MDTYIDEVVKSVLGGFSKSNKSNLTKAERQALLDLMNDKDIIIRPADKGSGVVVMNAKDYFDGLQKEVSDCSTYQPTDKDPTQAVYRKVKALADRLLKKGYIGKHLHRYLIPTRPRPGYLQGNPKLHKEGNPLRAIISGRGHATEGIAEIAEKQLESHVVSQPSFVKDTTEFITKIKDIKLPPAHRQGAEPLLFCMDVSRLYPSVPREEGIEACREALDLRSDPDIPTEEIIEMIKLVLDNNFSLGKSKHYTQVNGTAIGSRLGKNYACTYMGKWETRLLNSSMLKPFMYLRYIDDIFGIWLYGEETLRDFHNLANSIHKQIQVDLRFSKTTVEFLDVRVSMSGGGLCTDVYAKPTDSKAYLHFTSDHPSYMKKAIPSGLAMRAKRICSSDSNFRLQTEDIHKNLSSRGYPDRLIDNGLKRVGEMDRNALLEGTMKKRDKQGVPMVITYSSHLPDIRKILKEKRHLYPDPKI